MLISKYINISVLILYDIIHYCKALRQHHIIKHSLWQSTWFLFVNVYFFQHESFFFYYKRSVMVSKSFSSGCDCIKQRPLYFKKKSYKINIGCYLSKPQIIKSILLKINTIKIDIKPQIDIKYFLTSEMLSTFSLQRY